MAVDYKTTPSDYKMRARLRPEAKGKIETVGAAGWIFLRLILESARNQRQFAITGQENEGKVCEQDAGNVSGIRAASETNF